MISKGVSVAIQPIVCALLLNGALTASVVPKTDAAGAVTWEASYEAYGTRTREEGINSDRQRANTKDEDPTGLLNEGFRYRDLETGTFISRDPAGFVDGPNLYAYVNQNPWTSFDPLGLFPGTADRTARFAEANARARAKGTSFNSELQSINQVHHGAHIQAASLQIDVLPVVGTAKGAYETITGVDPLTGNKLSTLERGLAGTATVASVVIPGAKLGAKLAGEGVETALRITDNVVEAGVDVTLSARKIAGFNKVESAAINEARSIMGSKQMQAIREAYESGKSAVVEIGGRKIQYEPRLPASGFTNFEGNGFLIGPEAFTKSSDELGKTILHELHRLNTSATRKAGTEVSQELVTQETKAAAEFAERAAEHLD